MRPRRGPGVVVLLLGGCAASPTPTTTWEDDARDGVLDVPSAPRPRPAALAASPPPAFDALHLSPEAAARRLERSLASFGAEQRRLDAGSGAWGVEGMRSWRRVLTEVERALEQPAGALPRRLLIQTRVVLEAERDRASDPPPDDIAERVRQAFVRVARRLQNPSDARDEGAAPGQLTLSWPVSPIILTSGFGHRPDPIHRDGRIGFHAGVDLAGHRGDEIYAAAKGEVIFAGRKGGLGRAIFVQHAGGFVTVYAHLSRALVVPGTLVDRQTCVGLMGSTGRATGAHLHFEIRFGGVPLDPLEHLRLGASTAAR